MKARAEGETHRRGLDDRELKRGRGGIRDIEFAVQLLQLVHGRHDPTIRSANTLDALAQLVTAGLRRPSATRCRSTRRTGSSAPSSTGCSSGTSSRRTRSRPTPTARTRLARVLGYRDQRRRRRRSSSSTPTHRAHQARVRSTHEKLFFGPLLETLSGRPGPLTADAAEERLRAFGFLDLRATRAAFDELTRGFSRTSRLMEQLLPLLLEWCSESPDPDLALLQLRRLAEGPARSAQPRDRVPRLARARRERTCRILGSSRMLGDALRRQPEFVQTLGDDDALAEPKPRERFVEEARRGGRSGARDDANARRSGLRRFKRRELLRIASRDLLVVRRPRRDRPRPLDARRGVPRGRARRARSAGAVRGHRHGPLRRARPLVRVGPRRAVRLRRRRRRPTSTRPSASPSSCSSRSASAPPEGRTFAIDASAAARGQAGLADPLARRATATTGSATG